MRKGFGFALLVAALGTFFVTGGPAYADCGSPANAIEAENCLPGTPPTEWDISGAGDRNLQGFATDVGVNRGETISFKVSTTATAYRIDIYRLGYYGGDGARKVATIPDALTAKASQPPCLTGRSGLVDCGNWSVSASWAVPASAVSGIYVAKLVGEAGVTGASRVAFVVRHDGGTSDLLFQTSDATSLFHAEYPMVRWLERNGYDVSYFTGVDAGRRGREILGHRVYLSVGRGESWSKEQRTSIETARDHTPPVHLAFFGSHRQAAGESVTNDPGNALTGTIFNADGGQSAIQVPEADGKMRFWRDTPNVATLAPGAAWTGPEGTLGREWGEDLDRSARPAGLVRLSTRAGATATHHAVFHRRPNGALVFASGTLQWSWGLDGVHEGFAASPSADMQQATVNLFADMGVQAATLQAGLVPASASADVAAPVSDVTFPADGATVSAFTPVIIQGTATDGLPGLVGGVEVSVDGGATWHPAEGRGSWSYAWTPAANGSYAILSRAVDDSGNLETPGAGRALTVGRDAVRSAGRALRTRDFVTAVAGTFTDNVVTGEFGAGSPDANIAVTAVAPSDGDVQLANVPGSAEFDVFPTNWVSTAWPSGGTATVAGGLLTVDGALANSASGLTYGPGTTLEFVATFGGAPFQNVGFGAGIDGDIFNNTPPAAMFSTGSDGSQVYARVWTAGFQDFALGALAGTSHIYKIVWRTTGFEFYVDNGLVHTQATAVAGPMRVAVSDFNIGAPAVVVDWLHVLSHPTPGTFVSRVFDSGVTTTSWKAMTWTAGIPAGTALAMSARISTTGTPTGAWVPISSTGTVLGGTARYAQYRAVLSTTNAGLTPVLQRVDVAYDTTLGDTTAPTIVTRTPAVSATGVAVGTTVVVQFSEVMNAATITTATFRLRALGAPADVAATVVTSGNLATLTPSAALGYGTAYTVTLSGATVADLSGNILGSDAVWTFTTATPSFTDTTLTNFQAALTSTCLVGSFETGGDVVLNPILGSGFDEATLPAPWVVTGGGTGTVSGGALIVDGALVDTGTTLFAGPRALEFVATFGPEAYQGVGFGLGLADGTPWAFFGTGGTTNTIFARTSDGGTPTPITSDFPIPLSLVGSPHRYRIEWAATEVRYFIDGSPVRTEPITVAGSLRPLVSDAALGGAATLAVGGLRVSPFTTPCTLESRVFDAGQPVSWSGLSWTRDVPTTGTALAMSARSGNVAVPDATWTTYTAVAAPGSMNAGIGRYAQYRAVLSASDTTRTPVLEDVTLSSSVPPSYVLTVTTPTNGTITGTGITCGGGSTDCTETYSYGTVVTLTATPATGYTFTAWTGACTGIGPCNVTMTAARTVGATFTVQQYTLTVTPPTNGTVTATGINCGTGGTDCTQDYNYNTVVALTATPATGYNFGGWTGACSGVGACSVTMTAAQTVGATFTIQQITLTVTAPTNGTITGTGIACGTAGTDCTETYSYGSVVPLTAVPDTGFSLSAWTGACSGAGACSVSMTVPRTVGATFALQRPILTVTAPTHGTITATGISCGTGGTDCTEAYDYGTVVPLTAIPDIGYNFGAWTGACSGAGACSLSMTAAQTVGATFTIQRYTLSVTTPTNGTITATGISCGTGGTDCTETYDYGTVVPLTGVPATGYNFGAWTGACSGAGACSVTMSTARTVGATFTIQRFTLTVTTPTHGRITATGISCGTGGSDCTEIYDYGTVVPLAATPDAGYGLRAWAGVCTGTGACSATMTAARTVGGLFALTIQQRKGDPSTYTGPELILNAPAAPGDATPEVVTGPVPPLESRPASAPEPGLEPMPAPKSAPEPTTETRPQPRLDLGPMDSALAPDVPRVVVTGEVRNPGVYAWFPGMTARQLIFAAGGLTADASEGVNLSTRLVPGATSMDDPVPEGETLAVRRQRF